MTPREICLASVEYNPATGVLRSKCADVLFGTAPSGRINCTYFGKACPATHVIWYYMMHKFPRKGMVIDHIDRNPGNNKWRNLRQVSKSENCRNRTHSVISKSFIGNVNFEGESYLLGYYSSQELADAAMDAAYAAAARGEFSLSSTLLNLT